MQPTSAPVSPYAILFLVQGLFMAADLLAKKGLIAVGFTPLLLTNAAFMAGLCFRALAIAGQFWLMSQQPLGKVMTLLFVAGIIASNVFGWLLFQETLSVKEYLGVGLAILALLAFIL